MGSCLKKKIETIRAPVKTLLLWSDSCGGQNRSIKLVLMMIHILQNHPSLETISLRFLLSGHSFLPNDSEFADAERYLKEIRSLYTIEDYTDGMAKCRTKNPFIIERMCTDEFFSVKRLENAITNRKVDIKKIKISWLDTHEIYIEKSKPFIINMRSSTNGEFQSVNIEQRGPPTELKTINLEKLWPEGRPLSNEKVKDLKQLLLLVPDHQKPFYSFLNHVPTAEFIDDVDGFGQSIDFEVEDLND